MKHLPIAIALLLVGCASEPSRITYTKDGTDMIATLSDGTSIRVPCVTTSTRDVSRIPQEVDDCEMALEHRQYLQERQAAVDARERAALGGE